MRSQRRLFCIVLPTVCASFATVLCLCHCAAALPLWWLPAGPCAAAAITTAARLTGTATSATATTIVATVAAAATPAAEVATSTAAAAAIASSGTRPPGAGARLSTYWSTKTPGDGN